MDLFHAGHSMSESLSDTPIQIWGPYMALRRMGAIGLLADGVRHHMLVQAGLASAGAHVKLKETSPWMREIPGALPDDELVDEDVDGGFARTLLRKHDGG